MTASGADLFYKENYPLIELMKKGEQFVIKDVYPKGEEQFILLLMGKAI
ncbi:hypothetical protein ACSFB8_09650 [Enterococcus faecalis]